MDIAQVALILFIGVPFVVLSGGFFLIGLKIRQQKNVVSTLPDGQVEALSEYISRLEARIASLENQLASRDNRGTKI